MNSWKTTTLFALRITGTLLGISFLLYQVVSSMRGFDWSKLSTSAFEFSLIGLLLSILAVVLQMTAWKIVLSGINQNVALADIFSGFSLSFVARYIPGTIWGYLSRSEWLKREHGVPYSVTNLGSVVETIANLAANLFIVVQGYLFLKNPFLSIVFAILFLFGGWAFLNLLLLWEPSRKLFHLDQNNIQRFPLSKWTVLFMLFIGMWYCYGFGLTVFAGVINIDISLINILEISSIYSLAWFIGFIVPFLPSGLGLREFSLTILMVAQFGLGRAEASFAAIGFRVIVSAAEFIWILYGAAKKTIARAGEKITL